MAVAACSTPPSHFYTLGDGGAQRAAPSATPPAFLIDVEPVAMPSELARTAFVMQRGQNRVDVLEQTRWVSLPSDEVRHALSVDLMRRLGSIDVADMPHPQGATVYRVILSVQRFESWPGSHTLLDAVWSVRVIGNEAVLTCRSVISETVESGDEALVAGHRQSIQQIADQIAAGIDAVAAARQVRAPVPASQPYSTITAVPCPPG